LLDTNARVCSFAEAYQDKAEGCHEVQARIRTAGPKKRDDQEINIARFRNSQYDAPSELSPKVSEARA